MPLPVSYITLRIKAIAFPSLVDLILACAALATALRFSGFSLPHLVLASRALFLSSPFSPAYRFRVYSLLLSAYSLSVIYLILFLSFAHLFTFSLLFSRYTLAFFVRSSLFSLFHFLMDSILQDLQVRTDV